MTTANRNPVPSSSIQNGRNSRRTSGQRLLVGTASIAIACIAAACSSSSGSTPPTTQESVLPTTAGSSTQTTVNSADQSLATAAVLQLSDMPTGATWTSQGSASTGSSQLGSVSSSQMATCEGTTVGSAQVSTSSSPGFGSSTATVQDQVQVFPNATAAMTDASLFSAAKAPTCVAGVISSDIASQLSQAAGSSAKVDQISSTVTPIAKQGDFTAEIQLVIPVTALGQTHTEYISLVEVVLGRVESQLLLTSGDAPFSDQWAVELAGKAVQRMA